VSAPATWRPGSLRAHLGASYFGLPYRAHLESYLWRWVHRAPAAFPHTVVCRLQRFASLLGALTHSACEAARLGVCTRYILILRPARRAALRPGPEADNSQLFTLHVRVVQESFRARTTTLIETFGSDDDRPTDRLVKRHVGGAGTHTGSSETYYIS